MRNLALMLTLVLSISCGFDVLDGLVEDDEAAGQISLGNGKADGTGYSACETKAALDWLNDGSTTASDIHTLQRVTTRAANNIIAHRDGPDGVFGTADDDLFDDLVELDKVAWVGVKTIARIVGSAKDQCASTGPSAEVVFSPRAYADSHIQAIIKTIDKAQTSLDIAMYNLSDSNVEKALTRALTRGVAIRVASDNAAADRKSPAGTKSARLEQLGIDVRWVNKINHHKYVIVDGPQTAATATVSAAAKAILVTGSGNWSSGAATRYDENTLFLYGVPELVLKYQREFNLLWNHSRDFVWDATLSYVKTAALDPTTFPDDAATGALFTSANFSIKDGSTTFRKVSGRNAVSDAIVAEIKAAKTSIHIASGHLRSRPISEALLAAKKANPSLDIKVYLDGQEYVSYSTHKQELSKQKTCLAKAGTSTSKKQSCMDKGFHYGYPVQAAGIALRFKYYAYRWNYSYAKQMHHKYFIIDGGTLITGSYNLSDNAEHNTFENMVVLRAPTFSKVILAYQYNFNAIWQTDASGSLLSALKQKVSTSSTIPLVFSSMALTHKQVRELKSLIISNCPAVNTYEYRKNPEKHTNCYRD